MKEKINSITDLQKKAESFLETLRPKDKGATLVALSGDLGVGKTAFTKSAAKVLGVKDSITSPTFTIAEFYRNLENSNFKQLIHVDAYRLENMEDLEVLGFSEWMQDVYNLIFFEWPNQVNLPDVLVDYFIFIEHGEKENKRFIEIRKK